MRGRFALVGEGESDNSHCASLAVLIKGSASATRGIQAGMRAGGAALPGHLCSADPVSGVRNQWRVPEGRGPDPRAPEQPGPD